MIDLSNYDPIYIRLTGNDTTGNGSISSPYFTAQKAFEVAYNAVGNKVLDFGAGNFGGVNLGSANANEWPNRIAIRGLGSGVSFLGDIIANGVNGIWDYENNIMIQEPSNGKNITLISDKSISVGDINSNGGNGDSDQNGGNGGQITITYVICRDISSSPGGVVTYPGNPGYPGLVIVNNSLCRNISCNGTGSEANNSGGGNVTLNRSIANEINSSGGSGYSSAGNGGNITIINSCCKNIINANFATDYGNTGTISSFGTITFIGHCVLPNTVIGNMNISQLIKTCGINSSILGAL